jgi:hypothetical protein
MDQNKLDALVAPSVAPPARPTWSTATATSAQHQPRGGRGYPNITVPAGT